MKTLEIKQSGFELRLSTEEKEQILTSEKDKEIFFNAILSNNEPGEKLKKASEKYLNWCTSVGCNKPE